MRRFNQRGDTIIEVLIVLAVLGFAFAISMATATRGLQQARNSEEHSRALGTENGQMELLRLAVSKQIDLPDEPFCLNSKAEPITGFPPGYTGSKTPKTFLISSFPKECVTEGLYVTSIVGDDKGNYVVLVNWMGSGGGAGGSQAQNELMTYRTHELTVDASYDTNIGSGPMEAHVIVRAIPIKSGNIRTDRTPSCADAATAVKGGSIISLRNETTGITHAKGTTSSLSSSVVFGGINEYHTYSATLHGTPKADDWKPCKGTSPITLPNKGPSKQALPNQTITFSEFKIYPQCKKVQVRDPDTPIYGPPYNAGGQPIYHYGHFEPIYGPVYYSIGARRGDLDIYANSGYNGTFQNYPLPGAIGKEVGSPHTHAAVPNESGVKYFSGYLPSGHHEGKGYYGVNNADPHQDIVGWSDHQWHVVGYTPDDWRQDVIGWQQNYHDEYPCPS